MDALPHMGLLGAAGLACGWLLWTRRRGAFLALFALLAVAGTFPLAFHLDRIPANTGASNDAYLFMWNLWWVKTSLLRLSNPFYCDLLYFPSGTTLVFHGLSLTQAIVSLPLQLLRGGLEGVVLAYDAVVLGSFWIAGYAAYRMAWHVVGDRAAAVVCGIGFGFSNYHFAGTVRLHALAVEWIPIYLLALLGLLERGRVRDGLGLGLAAVAVFYASKEYAYFLALASVLFAGFHLLGPGRPPGRRLAPLPPARTLLAAALPLLLTWPFWTAFLDELRLTHAAIGDQARNLSADLLDYALPNARHPWYGEAVARLRDALHRGSTPVAMGQSLGVGLLALAGVVRAVRRRSPALAPWVVTVLVFGAITLGPELRVGGRETGLPGGHALLRWLPGLEQSRVPVRAVPLVHLALGVLAAYGLQAWRARLAPRPARALALGVGAAALVFFETLQVPLRLDPVHVPRAYAEVDPGAGSGALLDWPPGRGPSVEVEGLHQIVHGRPLVQDLPLFLPRAALETRRRARGPAMQRLAGVLLSPGVRAPAGSPAAARESRALRDLLQTLGIRHVVLRRRDMAPPAYRPARDRLLSLDPRATYEDAEAFLASFRGDVRAGAGG